MSSNESFLSSSSLKKIDAHHHLWKYDPVEDSWITNPMSVIKKDFLPGDLELVLRQNGIDGSVVVQSKESEAENEFQLKNAEEHDFIKGVVGWINLQADDIEEKLIRYQQYKKLKGFRYVLQFDPQRNLMLQPAFKNGISLLNKYGFTYDFLIFPDQLKYAQELAAGFPEQAFVVDHIAKPAIKNKEIKEWKKDMKALSAYSNVYCKMSGMVTESDWETWTSEDFKPYMDIVVESFGTSRIMYGSDWPVCLLAASYQEVKEITEEYFSSFTKSEKENIFGKTAIEFYKL